MNEQIQLLRRQVRMIWPYRWVALIMATILSVVGWGVVLYLPNQYEVAAKIFIDTRSMLRPLMKGLAIDNNNLSNTAMLMKRTLLTRPNLEEVARKTDLDLTAKTDQEFDKLVASLAERIKMSGARGENIYQIKFEDNDPQLAKRVVDELLNEFLETALGSSRIDTATTQKFIDEQIAEYEKRLIEAEQRLKEFKQRNHGMMPGDDGNYFARLEAARARLEAASLELKEAQNRRNEMRRQLEGDEPVFGMMGGESFSGTTSIPSEFDARIAALEGRLDELLLQYTEKHPEVVTIKNLIAALEEKRAAEMEEQQAAQTASGPTITPEQAESPIYREMRMAVGQIEAEIAALSTRVENFRKKVEDLEEAVDTIPEIEAELRRLDRDYDLNRKNYNELLERRESARLSEEVDEQADDAKLKVIEPPRIPLTPIGPDRILYISMVLLMALGAGGGLAVLLAQINPRFSTAEELKEFAQLPVMGVVSLVSNRRQRTERRMELAVFSLMLSGLLSVYGALVVMVNAQVDLNGRVVEVVEAIL